MPPLPQFRSIFGVDFSGAKLAGRNTWIARVDLPSPIRTAKPVLVALDPLERLAGVAEREPALARLVALIKESESALWAMDFPFAMPVEVMRPRHACSWRDQLDQMHRWRGGAYAMGVRCVERCRAGHGKLHIRRLTDSVERTPFDCYHYRIIYQTYHGMRDVLRPLAADRGTAVLPFDYAKLRGRAPAARAVIESCPGSTLKRLGWPHQNYKQPTGGPLTHKRRTTRRRIVGLLCDHFDVPDAHRRVMMRNPGGDALDAALAALGAHLRFPVLDHKMIARHPRFVREGFVYA